MEVLLGRFTRLGQWSGPEVLFFFGMMQCVFALVEFVGRGVSNFAYYVGSGEFDTLLVRPRNLLVQVFCTRLDPRRLGGILVGLCALGKGLEADQPLHLRRKQRQGNHVPGKDHHQQLKHGTDAP